MSALTWDQFKDKIDNQLKEHGEDGSIEIWFIDISYPEMDYGSEVQIDSNGSPSRLSVS